MILMNIMLDIAENAKSRIPFINHDYVESIIQSHLQSKKNNGQKILSLVNLFSWLSKNYC